MKTLIFIIILVVAVLGTLALSGWIFYSLLKRWLKSQQKERLLQMKIDERQETLRVVRSTTCRSRCT